MRHTGGQPGGGADAIVVNKFNVRYVGVPVVLSFVADHRLASAPWCDV